MNTPLSPHTSAIYGCLLGTAVGDAYGLPYENLSSKRAKKWFKPYQYRFIWGIKGAMVSDDTEHSVLTTLAYIHSQGNIGLFPVYLRKALRCWFLCLPAGIGLATLRSCLKMCLGFKQTSVYSAGNGGAIRSAILGVLSTNLDELKQRVILSTTLTHHDPKAIQGSLVVAYLAWIEYHHPEWTEQQALNFVYQQLDDKELIQLIKHFSMPKQGITGYMYHTIPAVCQAWQRFRHSPVDGLNWLIQQGGDTDTTCAIFAAITGVRYGEQMAQHIQGRWCEPIISPSWLKRLAEQATMVAQQQPLAQPLRLNPIIMLMRNLCFMIIVLIHGFRRLLPPY